MISNPAPLLQRLPFSPVARAYHAWVEHYNSCEFCARDEWMSPLLGEPFFCDKGRGLFKSWVNAARIAVPTLDYMRHHARHQADS